MLVVVVFGVCGMVVALIARWVCNPPTATVARGDVGGEESLPLWEEVTESVGQVSGGGGRGRRRRGRRRRGCRLQCRLGVGGGGGGDGGGNSLLFLFLLFLR